MVPPDQAQPPEDSPQASEPPAADPDGSGFPSPAWMTRRAQWASYLLVAGALLLVMLTGLLAGLLYVCLALLSTRHLGRRLTSLAPRLPSGVALQIGAVLVVLAPLALLFLAWTRARGMIIDAPSQYRELLNFLAATVMELRQKLPPGIADLVPDGIAEMQRMIAGYLGTKAGSLAMASRAWLVGLAHAYIGLAVGALAATRPRLHPPALKPLAAALYERAVAFGAVFRQIVVAQFWIAAFNALLTAVFLLVLLPLWDAHLPYRPALITFTFLAGLIPIVGNLMCNLVLTLVGLSVSPTVALACLVFLVVIHKGEYFINAKVIGHRMRFGVWELLAVMFTMEAVFGPAGLVAAPLFYAYLKQELGARGWV